MTTGSFSYIVSLSKAPLSTPVRLGGRPDFTPADPEDLRGAQGRARARVAFVGDIMQHREQAEDDFLGTYREIEGSLGAYDLVVGNLEFPVDPDSPVGPPPGEIRFNGSPEHVGALARAGIGLVTTANNHSFDMGLRGTLSTLEVLRAEGIESFGTGGGLEDLRPRFFEVNSLKLAFLGYTFPPNVYTDAEEDPIPWPRDWPINDLYFDDWSGPYREEGIDLFSLHVQASRDAGADFVIAYVHWGQEWRYAPDRHQRLAARDMIEAGIDLVIGSHSHVLNPAEIVDGKLVAYSLGNFVSAFRELEVRTSAILEVSLVEEADGRIVVGDFAFRPILTQGDHHAVRPIPGGTRGEAGRALRLARRILGEAAVEPFQPESTRESRRD
jgi:poly-gamma-glutamate synthesis protein (capsule biosynthesis protein)